MGIWTEGGQEDSRTQDMHGRVLSMSSTVVLQQPVVMLIGIGRGRPLIDFATHAYMRQSEPQVPCAAAADNRCSPSSPLYLLSGRQHVFEASLLAIISQSHSDRHRRLIGHTLENSDVIS